MREQEAGCRLISAFSWYFANQSLISIAFHYCTIPLSFSMVEGASNLFWSSHTATQKLGNQLMTGGLPYRWRTGTAANGPSSCVVVSVTTFWDIVFKIWLSLFKRPSICEWHGEVLIDEMLCCFLRRWINLSVKLIPWSIQISSCIPILENSWTIACRTAWVVIVCSGYSASCTQRANTDVLHGSLPEVPQCR